MSKENIRRFYAVLEVDAELKKEALSLQEKFDDQERVIEEFIALAERAGFPFTIEEYLHYLCFEQPETKQ